MRILFLTSILVCNYAFANDVQYTNVAPGDVEQLKQAILDANARDIPTSIEVSGTYEFSAADSLPPISSTVSIYGSQRSFVRFRGAADGGPNEFLTIESNGNLTIGFVEVSRFEVARLGGNVAPSELSPLAVNNGRLNFDRVVFRDMGGGYLVTRFDWAPPLIRNSGTFIASKSSFINSGFYNGVCGLVENLGYTKFERSVFESTNVETPICNYHETELLNVSYQGNPQDGSDKSIPLLNDGRGIIRVGNSIFADIRDEWCREVTSLGHNLVENADCNFSADGDLVGVATGLLPLSADPELRQLFLSAASPAVDNGDPKICEDVGVLALDGDGDGIAICDRGAIEFVSKGLSDGGANGLFYDPGQDGHYVYVLDNDANTLVVWNTFDIDGNQAWVLAIGDLADGRSMIADAYTNEDGVLTEFGPTGVSRDVYWGTIQLELDSCNEGTFYFDSDLANFTDGLFSIKRLASVTQIGCED